MSKYTSLILIISSLEDERARLREVKEFEILPKKGICLTDINDTKRFPDIFPRHSYAGTYNYLDLDSFREHLAKVKWEYPQYVQLIVKEEESYTCKIYGDAGRRLDVDSIKW
ncbi:MAG TPA: hypothetical protein VF691_00080 [Cytophagaceae bacterium]|jgi:hypothetical protein